jgi:hypothetical protein
MQGSIQNQNLDKIYGKRKSALRRLGFNSYDSYLKSKLWASIKIRLNRKHNNKKCRFCSNPRYAYHHLKYNYPILKGKASALKWIIPTCKKCHSLIHKEEILSRLQSKDVKEIDNLFKILTQVKDKSLCPDFSNEAEKGLIPLGEEGSLPVSPHNPAISDFEISRSLGDSQASSNRSPH